jgi:hypothetical protein
MDSVNQGQLKITAISVPDLVKLLKRAGAQSVSEGAIREDIERGAPTNPDGSVNLIHYTAWLQIQVSAHRENPDGFSVPADAGN